MAFLLDVALHDTGFHRSKVAREILGEIAPLTCEVCDRLPSGASRHPVDVVLWVIRGPGREGALRVARAINSALACLFKNSSAP